MARLEIQQTKTLLTKAERKRLKDLEREVHAIVRRRGSNNSDSHSAVGSDMLARNPELTFIEVKVNGSKSEHGQKEFLDLARKHQFAPKVIRVSIEITKSVSIQDY